MLLIFLIIVVFLAWSTKQSWTAKLTELPLSFLVGFQGFRIVVEALIHLAVHEGVAHPTMTCFGTNWDITAGVSALLLAPFANRISSFILQIWNVSMLLILVITVVTGVMPLPSHFGKSWANQRIHGLHIFLLSGSQLF